jgi:hypothetical protein
MGNNTHVAVVWWFTVHQDLEAAVSGGRIDSGNGLGELANCAERFPPGRDGVVAYLTRKREVREPVVRQQDWLQGGDAAHVGQAGRARAKYADALRTISFARFSSRSSLLHPLSYLLEPPTDPGRFRLMLTRASVPIRTTVIPPRMVQRRLTD